MKLSSVCQFYSSRILWNRSRGGPRFLTPPATTYHNRGKPKRILRDDGSDYYSEAHSPLTKTTKFYTDQLDRLDRLEKYQLQNCAGGCDIGSSSNSNNNNNSSVKSSKTRK